MQREAMKSITYLTRYMSSPHKLIDCSQPPSKYLEATVVHMPDLNAGRYRHRGVTPVGLPLTILSSKSIVNSFPDWALRIHSDTGGQYLIKHLDSLLSHERSDVTALTEEPIVFCGRLDASQGPLYCYKTITQKSVLGASSRCRTRIRRSLFAYCDNPRSAPPL